jgi:hypothetical protein
MGIEKNIRQRHYLAHILISEAVVGFSLWGVDQLTGWPVGQKEANERPGGTEAQWTREMPNSKGAA